MYKSAKRRAKVYLKRKGKNIIMRTPQTKRSNNNNNNRKSPKSRKDVAVMRTKIRMVGWLVVVEENSRVEC